MAVVGEGPVVTTGANGTLDAGNGTLVPAATGIIGFAQTPGGKNFFLMLGLGVVIAVMAVVWLWSQKPDYRVLFSNFSDRDGGAIVAQLQQMGVPYKYAEGGNAILIPAEQVHDVRLKLAAQGLPKGGNVGFELMENQKLGVSQFLEQVNFQRALEGELARSIQSVAAVQAARVHLAMPKASVFVRDQQKPTASVLLNLHPGRSLDAAQVRAIVHIVASSVPDLHAKNVTVVDQDGSLLSENDRTANPGALDPAQLKYVHELQQSIVKRIESLLSPVVGANNLRAEATADVDFSRIEQAAETYRPNQDPAQSTVRSQQTSEVRDASGANATGVPGALTNQPPVPATAPLTTPAVPDAAAGQTVNNRKDATINYEVDKTVRYMQQPMGGIKRLSVGVVVNHKRETGKDGKITLRPLTEAELTQITNLVREAMGYSKERGDTLNVVNTPFAGMEKEVIPEVPLWKQPEMIDLAIALARYLVGFLIIAWLFFKFIKPVLNTLSNTISPPPPQPENKKNADGEEMDDDEDAAIVHIGNETEPMGNKPRTYQENLEAAKELARTDPKMVANIVKQWVGTNE